MEDLNANANMEDYKYQHGGSAGKFKYQQGRSKYSVREDFECQHGGLNINREDYKQGSSKYI